MIFRQFIDESLGCGSYLIGDPDRGQAVVVDPAFAIDRYLEAAANAGLRLVGVLETHTHADHLSGHGRLALERALPVSIHPLAEAEYPFEPLSDGMVITLGQVTIRVVHTPGHRPEHCSFVVDERILLSGDSLFVGDAARPDLAVEPTEGATALYGSLARLAELPDDAVLYPGHVAGSLCGVNMSHERSSTIGHEKATNRALAYSDVGAFVQASTSINVPPPPTTARLVALNRGPWVARPPDPPALTAPDAGAIVLDVRSNADFGAGHVHGAINVPVDEDSFGARAAFVVRLDEQIVIRAADERQAAAAAQGLWAVGFLDLAGTLAEASDEEQMAPVGISELKHLLATDAVQVVDVREADELDDAVPGSLHVPYRLLREDGASGLDPAKPIVTVCGSGSRAAIGASLLARRGFEARPLLDAGVHDLTA